MMQNVQTIHVIFKTHLDVGFTDFASKVVAGYRSRFLPQAIATARELRARRSAERFIWTTGAWLIHHVLDVAPPAERAQLEEAIAAGDVTWHALPFTMHSELASRSLFRFGLSLSQELDRRFGRTTIAAKFTDVPGHTRAVVPLLAEAGVRFLHIGVNPASTPPAVPPVFVWRAPDGSEIMVMYQRGSYGDLVVVPGLTDAIAFAHTGDNLGPQAPEQVLAEFARLHAQFPAADVRASTLDAFAHSLASVKDQLPVVTAELGDTWIHGVGTDPYKVAAYRALCRVLDRWTGNASGEDSSRRKVACGALLMVPEHTWGLDVKTHLPNVADYAAERFAAVRNTAAFRAMEASWAEQRAYVDEAVAALADTPYAAEATAGLAALQPSRTRCAAHDRVVDPDTHWETPQFVLSFDPATGAISFLRDKRSGRVWATPQHPLGTLRYQTFSAADYERFHRRYNINKRATEHWSRPDFTKPGLEQAEAEARMWLPTCHAVYRTPGEQATSWTMHLAFPAHTVAHYGAPRLCTLEYLLPNDARELHVRLQWFDKQACRLPEALWLSFVPRISDPRGWRLDKMGEPIDPHDVVRDGNRRLHAVARGVTYHDRRESLAIDTLDAPLVAPGEPALLHFTNRLPSLRRGMHFNLYNNSWGTNFPMWYDNDAVFRFVLRLG